ncbi:MAG: GAF domain-containing protein [Terriglobia bacterium]
MSESEFPKEKIQQSFREHTRVLFDERLRVFCYFGVALLMLVGGLDLFIVKRELLPAYLSIRAATALILVGIVFFVYPALGRRFVRLWGMVGSLLVAFCLSISFSLLGESSAPYYAGLNLLILGVTLIMPFTFPEAALALSLVYAAYFLPLWIQQQSYSFNAFVNNHFLVIGTILVALAGSYYAQKLRFREYRSRYQLAQSNQKLTALDNERTLLFSNLGNLIQSGLEWQKTLNSLIKLIKENLGFRQVACLKFDPTLLKLHTPILVEGDDTFKTRVQLLDLPEFHSIQCMNVLRDGHPVLLDQAASSESTDGTALLRHLQSLAAVLIPLRENGKTTCVLLAGEGQEIRELSEERFHFLISLSQPISAALEKARVFESERKRTLQLLLIHEISRILSSILDIGSVFQEYAKLLQQQFHFRHISIFTLDEFGQPRLRAQAGDCFDLNLPEESAKLQNSLIGRAMIGKQTIYRTAKPEATRLDEALLGGSQSQLCIPFQAASRPMGVVVIESEKSQAFDSQDIKVLEALNEYLAIWINNADLYSETKRKASALQTINSVGKAISSELHINSLFELIFHQVTRVLPSEDFLIALMEEDRDRIEVKFEVSRGQKKSAIRTLPHDSLVGHVLQTCQPLMILENYEERFLEITGKPPVVTPQSWLGVPLMSGEKSMGVIVLQDFQERKAYDADDLNLLSTIADQAAGAISNARLYREAEERAIRLAVVNEITREAALNLEVDKLFHKITMQLNRVVSFEKCSIAIYDAGGDSFELVNVYGENITAGFYKGMHIPGCETVMKIAVETKQPYYSRSLNDIISHPSPYLMTQGILSAVSIPILSEDLCLGTLNLGSAKEEGFSRDQIDLLCTVASGLGNALKNARLYTALEQSYSDLQATQDQLIKSEKLRALGEMSAGVAHDFNNILGAIIGRAQLMKGQIQDQAVLRGLDIIEKAAVDGAFTIKRLQEFTRKQSDQAFKHVDLVQVLEDTLSMTRTRWEDTAHVNGIQYDISTQFEPILPIAGERSELIEVFTNILFNALDAMPGGGKIHIHVGTRNDQVFASVTDWGRGMDEETRRRVFDPFFTTKGVKGNGLGMSVAYGIINRHKGEIEISSELGRGTTVRIFLPVNHDAVRESVEEKILPQKKKARFLIIDDEEPIRDLLAELFLDQGHEVFTASGGKDGIEMFRTYGPDLVITDLGMPEVSGWEVASTIKSLQPSTQVILMTGWGITLENDQVQQKGVDVVVSKPFQINEIQKVVNDILETRPNMLSV